MAAATAQQKRAWQGKAARAHLSAILAESARQHEAELDAGKPVDLKLTKVRKGFAFAA